AVLGVQLVVTLLTATLMHRLAPHCSFARWLLCNGSCFDSPPLWLPPPRWANGYSEEKPLSVPRDAPFQLETCPLTAVDALVLRFFLEYQWFVDFAVYSGGVYVFTEAYYYALGPAKETNIAVFWCLLTVAFSIKMFLTVTRLYFSAEEGGERSVCLTFAFLFLLLAMLVQVVREETLELGLEPGLASMTQNLEPLLKTQGWDWALPLAKLAIRMGLAFVGSMLGAFLTFPGLRLAQTHLDALTMSEDRPMLQFLLQMSFLSPLIILGLWTKPIARDFLHQAPAGEMTFSLCESGGVGREGSWGPLCVPQPLSLREEPWVLGEDPGAGAASQPPHSPPHRLSGSALDSLSPWVPGAFCGYSWGLGPVPMLSPPPSSAHDRLVGPEEDEAQQTAARIAGALGSLLTPLFLRGVLTFLIWWTAACQLLSSLFGLYFHRYLAGS
uniref:Transmembrane protein 161A n=1 Tax=Panthera tigris altaica TaxID=74533 RepID=A0A8C9JT61_PANTA